MPPMPGPTESDGDRLARAITNEVGRTFYATGGERITGDQAFAQIMSRARASKRGR